MKKFATVLISVLTVSTLILVSCTKESEPKTVESLIKSSDEVATMIQGGASDAGVNVDIKDNAITYSYDMSNVDGVTEEMIANEDFLNSIKTSLDSQKTSNGGICKTIEEKMGIEGVTIKVIYSYGDKELASAEYTSADAEAETDDTDTSEDSAESEE